MLTSMGRQIRKLRLDKGIQLKDMAAHFNVTSSFISAVEHGRKQIPNDWPDKLDEYFSGSGVPRAKWWQWEYLSSALRSVKQFVRATALTRQAMLVYIN